jgi:hypothetical protein
MYQHMKCIYQLEYFEHLVPKEESPAVLRYVNVGKKTTTMGFFTVSVFAFIKDFRES